MFVAPIVEGHGEVEALPVLLHRISREVGVQEPLVVNPPIRVKSGSFLNDESYREKQLTLALNKAADRGGGVIVLLDCDNTCPAEIGPKLLAAAKSIRNDVCIFIALAEREYESWFLAAATSLRGQSGLPNDLNPPIPSEGIRGAKEWLSQRMDDSYDPITHQTEFTRTFGMNDAKTNKSFNRFYKKFEEMLRRKNVQADTLNSHPSPRD